MAIPSLGTPTIRLDRPKRHARRTRRGCQAQSGRGAVAPSSPPSLRAAQPRGNPAGRRRRLHAGRDRRTDRPRLHQRPRANGPDGRRPTGRAGPEERRAGGCADGAGTAAKDLYVRDELPLPDLGSVSEFGLEEWPVRLTSCRTDPSIIWPPQERPVNQFLRPLR